MKIITHIFISVLLSFTLLAPSVFATSTILPTGEATKEMTAVECKAAIDLFETFRADDNPEEQLAQRFIEAEDGVGQFLLSCAIKSGNIKFWMVPFFIRNILNFLIGLSGLISILMIMVGAYYYIAGGLTDDKEKGKKVITYAIGGLILTTLSWFIVNVILLAITN